MQMGCTLIDTKTIRGAYIDRTKNQVKGIVTKFDRKDSVVYHRPSTTFSGSDGDPSKEQDFLANFSKESSSNSPNDIEIVQIQLQVRSNMRLCLVSKENENKTIGDHPSHSNSVEYHRIQFERYTKMPKELSDIKKWTIEQAQTNEDIRKQISEEELFNPWVVTDFDEGLDYNKHVVKV